MSKVYLYKFAGKAPQSLYEAGKEVAPLIAAAYRAEDRLAVKVHFGERGNRTYLKPDFTRAVCEELAGRVQGIDLVECTVLYKGERSFASGHKRLALEHGFDFAPVEILDGEEGSEEVRVAIDGKHFQKARIGKGIEKYNALLVISHFKGHMATGFGGALKNVGMGLGSKGGKMAMHKSFRIAANADKCRSCGLCAGKCPGGAIAIEGKAVIDYEKCLGCGLCISVCPANAIEIPWNSQTGKELQERVAEYAAAVLAGRKAYFVNVLADITKHCDCMGQDMKPIMDDIGILLSDDIVALEEASLDLAGRERFTSQWLDPQDQIEHAVRMGLGSREYELVEIN